MMVRWGSWDRRTDRQMDCVGFKKDRKRSRQMDGVSYKQTEGLCKNRQRNRQMILWCSYVLGTDRQTDRVGDVFC